MPAVPGCFCRKCLVAVVVILNSTIAILVRKRHKTGLLPGSHPIGPLVIGQIAVCSTDLAWLNRIDQIVASHRSNSGSGRIENRDKQQRITGRHAGIANFGHREEPDDDMRQSRRADHQRHRDAKHINTTLGSGRVLIKTQRRNNVVELVEQGSAGAADVTAERKLWYRVVGNLDGDEDRRHGVGKNKYTVLRNLRVRDALHAAKDCVHEYDAHANHQTNGHFDLKKPREDDANAAHLAGDISKRNKDQADDRDDTRRLGVITFSDELRYRELTEFAQVRCEQ